VTSEVSTLLDEFNEEIPVEDVAMKTDMLKVDFRLLEEKMDRVTAAIDSANEGMNTRTASKAGKEVAAAMARTPEQILATTRETLADEMTHQLPARNERQDMDAQLKRFRRQLLEQEREAGV
jgi:hypothetical protein